MPSIIKAGELRHRATIRQWTDVPNNVFGLDQTFAPGIERWCKVDPVHGLAYRGTAQEDEKPTDFIWFRYGPGTRPEDITREHVIEWRGNRYRVLDAINVQDAQRYTRVNVKLLGEL